MSPDAIKVIRVEHVSLNEAKKQAMSQVPTGFEVISESVVSDGKPRKLSFSGDTLEAARVQVKLPDGANGLKREEIPPSRKNAKVVVEAFDEARAIAEARTKALADGHPHFELGKVTQTTPPKSGLLGLGKKPGEYEVEISESVPASVDVEYSLMASIVVKAADPAAASEMTGKRIPKIELSAEEREIFSQHGGSVESLALKSKEYLNSGQWSEALKYWRILTSSTPERATSWCMCGICHQKAYEEALNRALPEIKSTAGWGAKATDILTWQGARDRLPLDYLRQAIPYLNEAISRDSQSHIAWYISAHCFCHIGIPTNDPIMVKRGLDCFNQALNTKPGDSSTIAEMTHFKKIHQQLVQIA